MGKQTGSRDAVTGTSPLRGQVPALSAGADQSEVARIAYELFEQRGGVHGHDLEDWIEAERIVRERRRNGRR